MSLASFNSARSQEPPAPDVAWVNNLSTREFKQVCFELQDCVDLLRVPVARRLSEEMKKIPDRTVSSLCQETPKLSTAIDEQISRFIKSNFVTGQLNKDLNNLSESDKSTIAYYSDEQLALLNDLKNNTPGAKEALESHFRKVIDNLPLRQLIHDDAAFDPMTVDDDQPRNQLAAWIYEDALLKSDSPIVGDCKRYGSISGALSGHLSAAGKFRKQAVESEGREDKIERLQAALIEYSALAALTGQGKDIAELNPKQSRQAAPKI